MPKTKTKTPKKARGGSEVLALHPLWEENLKRQKRLEKVWQKLANGGNVFSEQKEIPEKYLVAARKYIKERDEKMKSLIPLHQRIVEDPFRMHRPGASHKKFMADLREINAVAKMLQEKDLAGGVIRVDKERQRKYREERLKRLAIEKANQKKFPNYEIDWSYVNGPALA